MLLKSWRLALGKSHCRLKSACHADVRLVLPNAMNAAVSVHAVNCSAAQVINKCSPDGPISPATCVYYNEWLSF